MSKSCGSHLNKIAVELQKGKSNSIGLFTATINAFVALRAQDIKIENNAFRLSIILVGTGNRAGLYQPSVTMVWLSTDETVKGRMPLAELQALRKK